MPVIVALGAARVNSSSRRREAKRWGALWAGVIPRRFAGSLALSSLGVLDPGVVGVAAMRRGVVPGSLWVP